MRIKARIDAPAAGRCRTERATTKTIVVQVPDRGLPRDGIVKDIVGLAVTIEVAQRPLVARHRELSGRKCHHGDVSPDKIQLRFGQLRLTNA